MRWSSLPSTLINPNYDNPIAAPTHICVGLRPHKFLSRATKGDIRHLAKSSTWHFGLPDKLSSIVTKADKNLRNCQKI